MRFDRFDLNLLSAFDVLAETRSVTATAHRLNLSQPAISGALKRLRLFFDDELFINSGRKMFLTPKAEELVEPVRHALALVRSGITKPGGFDPTTTQRRFIIVASDYSFTILLARIITEAERLAPGISFEIIPPSNEAIDRIRRAEIDLFVTVEQFRVVGHPEMKLWSDDEVIISWKESGYDQIDENVFYDAGHAVVMFGSDRQASLSDVSYNELERERRVELLLPNFSSLPQAIIGTRRLAIMHRLYAQHFARIYPIQIHESWLPSSKVTEIVQWHKKREGDLGVIWLLDLVRQHLADLPEGAMPNDLQ